MAQVKVNMWATLKRACQRGLGTDSWKEVSESSVL